jgi:hypothetical protein
MHKRFNLPYWRAQFPLEDLRAKAREWVLAEQAKHPDSYLGELSVEEHISMMEPHAEILIGPGSLAVNGQLRAEVFAGKRYQGARIATDVFVWERGEPPHPAMTKVGGIPYRPCSSAWPRDEAGKPVRFVAQFCFMDSRDLFGRLPGDVLLIFGSDDDLLSHPERLVFEWWNFDLQAPAVELPEMPADELLTPYYGVIHRTEDWPDALDEIRRDYRSKSWFDVYEGTKIGGIPSLVQGMPSVPGDFLASLGSITHTYSSTYRWQPHSWPPAEHELMIGDMGSLYLFLDAKGRVRAESQCY